MRRYDHKQFLPTQILTALDSGHLKQNEKSLRDLYIGNTYLKKFPEIFICSVRTTITLVP